MKILLVSATRTEIRPLLRKAGKDSVKGNFISCRFGSHSADVLITGIGMTATAFHLGKKLNRNYGLAIDAGIAGSFRKNIPPGSVVNVVSDCFSELGAEDGSRFLTAEEAGFGASRIKSREPVNRIVKKELSNIRKVKGITVNTVHGNSASIRKVVKKFGPDIETMEGAAFFLACSHEKIPCIQIRSVSNYVERRNRKNWKIDSAVKNLNQFLEEFLLKL